MAKQAHKQSKGSRDRVVAVNKRARFSYEVIDTFEAGLVLMGTEVKSLRQGQMSLDEAFARIYDDEAFLVGSHIPEYSHGNIQNHEPKRKRKLLLRRREIRKLKAAVAEKGLTLVPLKVYFSDRGYAKCTVAVCKGRKTHDKRDKLRKKEDRRSIGED